MGKGPSRPAKSTPVFCEEWRKIPWGDKKTYVQYLKDYKPFREEVQHLRILIHGPVGSGKSSFINSVDTVLQGRMTGQALVDAVSRETFTRKYGTHRIKKGAPGSFCKFVFTDSMGLERGANRGVSVEDIKLAMRGHVKDKYKFKIDSVLSQNDPDYNQTPSLNDKCHIVVCVMPASTCNLISDEAIEKMRDVRLAASDMGIPQVAILTKIDEACPEVQKDLRNVYKSSYVKQLMEGVSASLGFPMNCIFPVKNYHSEIDTNDNTDVLILRALKPLIYFGEDYLNSPKVD